MSRLSDNSDDPRLVNAFAAEMAAECFALARFCPSEADIGHEFLAGMSSGESSLLPDHAEPPRQRRPRKPSITTLVKRAEKTGKTVTSITTPDGTTIHFGEPEASEANNPWLDDLRVTKQ